MGDTSCSFCDQEDRIAELKQELEGAHSLLDEQIDHLTDPNYHPCLYLLAEENTGWKGWFKRWVYSSEPFRGDIKRRSAALEDK